MTKKKQKKKRNKKYIPRAKKACICGSGKFFENCCMPQNRQGHLLKELDPRFNDIHRIIIFEINTILQNLCIKSKFLEKIHSALIDMFILSDNALSSCKKHAHDLKKEVGVQKNSNTYTIDDFDHKFQFYVRYLFVSGSMLKDGLVNFSDEIGFNIGFLFGSESNKKFDSKLNKLIDKFQNEKNGLKLKDFILEQKEMWLSDFIEIRNNIEHGTFNINKIEYPMNGEGKLLPQYPLINGAIYNEAFSRYPINFFHFSREIIIFLLSELAYREKFSGDKEIGAVVPVKEEKMFFGDLNKEKIIYRFAIIDKKTSKILTTNFSRNCN